MSSFFSYFRRKSILHVAMAWALIAIVPASLAESDAHLEKHARKIEDRLARYRTGSFLQIGLRDNTDIYGSLGSLSGATFQFTNADSNTAMTISYADVSEIKKGKEYIGEGSAHVHHMRFLVPALIGAAAAGVAVALVETNPF